LAYLLVLPGSRARIVRCGGRYDPQLVKRSSESVSVTIALSCTVFELFDVEYYRDLEMWVRGHSRSLKLVPLESLGAVSYSSSIVTNYGRICCRL